MRGGELIFVIAFVLTLELDSPSTGFLRQAQDGWLIVSERLSVNAIEEG